MQKVIKFQMSDLLINFLKNNVINHVIYFDKNTLLEYNLLIEI